MKTRTLVILFSAFVLGVVFAAALFLERIIPGMNYHIEADAQFITLDDNQKPYQYSDLLSEVHMARTYLENPVYFYKRNEGYQMLADMAENLGYTPAAVTLYFYHANQIGYASTKTTSKEAVKHYNQARKWAELAAEQGDNRLLLLLLTSELTKEFNADVTEDLKVLEAWAKESTSHTAAWGVAKYYDELGNAQKAAEFHALEKNRLEKPLPEPACMTITPWRGQ